MQSASKDQQSQKKLNFEVDYNKHHRNDPTGRSNSLTFVNSPLKIINHKPTAGSSAVNDYLKVKIEISENNGKDSANDIKNAYQKSIFL